MKGIVSPEIRRTGVLPEGKTLPQGGFIPPEEVKKGLPSGLPHGKYAAVLRDRIIELRGEK